MTTPAIGASGVVGIAFEQLSAPVQAALSTATTGGTLAAGTYRYQVTALNASGETTVSNEQSVTTTGTTSTVTVAWATITNATGYNIYRTAVGGASGSELKLATVGAVTTFVDNGSATPAGALPAVNTASNSGTYTAPTKFFPFNSENIQYQQDTQWRRPIRNTAGILGAVAGNSHIEGDIEVEALSDVILYFLYATRCSITKTGSGPFTYIFTPTSAAIPSKTLSITITRNGQVFGYTGCVVHSFKLMVEDQLLKFTATILGRDEATQGVPVPRWPVSTPFGAGSYTLQIPIGTTVNDTDGFDLTVNDNGQPNYRIRSGSTGPAFINFGESSAELTVDRDFLTRADYDSFKALTAQQLQLLATKGANESITVNLPAAIKDTYEVGLSGEGELVRASIAYQGVIDTTGKHYQLTVVTPTENVI